MKNRLSKVVCATVLVASSLMAESGMFDDRESLVGVEVGYTSLEVERNDGSRPANIGTHKLPNGGLKIGAQSKNFRVFLSGRYYGGDDFDYITTYGAEIQYLLNISKYANIYFGGGGGGIKLRFAPSGEPYSRTVSDTYYSGDVGTNIHVGESVDIEVGVRVLALSASNTINNITYNFDNLVTGYASVIYKFKMD
jgi:hypothetical protein